MGLLAIVPRPLLLAAIVALGLLAAGQSWRLHATVGALSTLQLAVAAERLQAAEAARLASEAARAAERRRIHDLQEIAREADRNAERARTARTAADAAARRLHDSAAGFAAGGGAAAFDPSVAGPGPATADTARMLAQLLDQAVDEARRYAAIADERGIAGQACERSYDALIGPPAAPQP